LYASEAGKRVLLVSTDPAHSTADIFGTRLGPREQRLTENLWALEIDPEREASNYIDGVRAHLLRRAPERLRAEMERQIDMARVSPGAEEAALFDRVADIVLAQRKDWDAVVFDTAPTGHTLRLLTLPELLQAWIDGLLDRRRQVNQLSNLWRHMVDRGAPDEDIDDPVERLLTDRRRKFYQVRERLLDAGHSTFIFVLLAERLPILETAKAVAMLSKHGIPVGGLILNRVLPEDVLDPFLAARKEQERRYVEEIDRTFPELPRLDLPLLPQDVAGRESLEKIAAHLESAIEAGV
jgi:arsenite-transporting ATPase